MEKSMKHESVGDELSTLVDAHAITDLPGSGEILDTDGNYYKIEDAIDRGIYNAVCSVIINKVHLIRR